MTNTLAKCFAITLAVLMSSLSGAAEIQKSPRELRLKPAGDANYDCPSTLTGVTLKIESTLNAPSGWTLKPYPSEYQGMTVNVVHHAVSGNRLWCTYAHSGAPGALRTTSIGRPVPTGKTCTADTGFRFSCK